MIRGLYTSAWSMLANQRKMDVVTNNMANVNTTGYKKDTVVFQSFPEILTKRINDTQSPTNPSADIGTMALSSDVGEVYTYYTPGQMVQTGDRYDLAINDDNTGTTTSPAFFTVGVINPQNNNIQEFYTKDGSFCLDANNQLVTKDGYAVLGKRGPITLKPGDFTVDNKGNIIQNGTVVDTLRIAQFSDATQLRKFGNNLVQNSGSQVTNFTGSVTQGYSEQSNVNVIDEMVDMISVMRAYEANQKVLQSQDSTLDKAVNEVGVVR